MRIRNIIAAPAFLASKPRTAHHTAVPMLAAVLTTLLFSLSAIFGRRVSQWLSGTQANLGRLGLAALLLGAWSHWVGFPFRGRAFSVLLLSGCFGFGVGDLSMFQAYRRIGARRTVVILQCLAAVFGTFGEWLWLGHAPTLEQVAFGTIILLGIGVALLPGRNEHHGSSMLPGVLFGVVAALGQAAGAVLSRKAYEIAAAAGEPFRPSLADGVNAAYERMIGGILFSAVCFVLLKLVQRPAAIKKIDWKRGAPWLVGHALAGPVAGVTLFQWALMLQPASIVLPIVATTPLAVLPLAHFFEGDPITRRSVFGSAIAVAGVVGLVRAT